MPTVGATGQAQLSVHGRNVEVQLPEVFGSEAADLELDDDEPVRGDVVE